MTPVRPALVKPGDYAIHKRGRLAPATVTRVYGGYLWIVADGEPIGPLFRSDYNYARPEPAHVPD